MAGSSDDLARLVRRLRVERNYSQREAADRAGVSLTTWQSLERATGAGFRDRTLARVAQALDLSFDEILAAARRQQLEGQEPASLPGEAGDTDVSMLQPDRMLEDLVGSFRVLLRWSAADFVFVHSHASQLIDRLLVHLATSQAKTD